ncbi:hypothetical protein [Paenibacillus glucanolyticus]|uniref:hypothetical protein n=1 Tax=Paenibacillus glucanolyticus TaxID=59843 RepID=UPI00096CE029|nr:hypothetical protein [Paenibacillus glucanolyticus]OMF70492.1 hypothetical protein BK142_23755 [Paenibacillus glucanolyticus]
MNPYENDEWLKTLKVGDEVTYSTRWHKDVITIIKKITPTGQIKTEDNKTFKKGYCRLDTWDGCWLNPVTDEVRERILHRSIYRKVADTDWAKVSVDKLKRIADILDEGKEE